VLSKITLLQLEVLCRYKSTRGGTAFVDVVAGHLDAAGPKRPSGPTDVEMTAPRTMST
jgi:hypothetical protein